MEYGNYRSSPASVPICPILYHDILSPSSTSHFLRHPPQPYLQSRRAEAADGACAILQAPRVHFVLSPERHGYSRTGYMMHEHEVSASRTNRRAEWHGVAWLMCWSSAFGWLCRTPPEPHYSMTQPGTRWYHLRLYHWVYKSTEHFPEVLFSFFRVVQYLGTLLSFAIQIEKISNSPITA